jgi:hypothetical protein
MDKLKSMLHGHEDQASSGVGKAADMAKGKTGGKYDQQIDSGREKVEDQIRNQGGDNPQGQ